jgi:hypothetical protein
MSRLGNTATPSEAVTRVLCTPSSNGAVPIERHTRSATESAPEKLVLGSSNKNSSPP